MINMRSSKVSILASGSRGFSLLEVLITVVIVAVGLLGLGSLMLKGLQTNAGSQLRSIAVSQAYDLADRMRANVVGVAAGNYSNLVPPGSSTSCGAGAISTAVVLPAGSAISCSTTCATSCTVADVAARDVCQWHLANQALLGAQGAGAICKDAANNWYTIYVSWEEGKTGVADKTFALKVEP